MEPHFRLYPGQQELTPAQEAEARRFAQECICRQLSTEPVDEQEAEALLRQVYRVAGLPPPGHILWVDGPLQLLALAPCRIGASVLDRVRANVEVSVRDSILDRIGGSIWNSVWTSVRDRVEESVWDHIGSSVESSALANVEVSARASVGSSVRDSIWAYFSAARLAFYHFFALYMAPNDLHALACFNQMVSGYRLGQDLAVIVRRPKILSRDEQGRLHSATGKCIAYRDGWGLCAWHGVKVPERVILAPEQLTRQDWSEAEHAKVRHVIQERMGSRFVSEVGGQVLDRSLCGTLYEVALPRDPEQVARYVQVSDPSTERQYYVRVPPTIQTAAEAVAWSFGLSIDRLSASRRTRHPASKQEENNRLDAALRLRPGQQELTPAQEAEARRFAQECICRQLSTEPVDEQEAEALLRQAYRVAGLAPPEHILWVDGPLQLLALAPHRVGASLWNSVRANFWACVRDSVWDSVWSSIGEGFSQSVWHRVWVSVHESVRESIWVSVGERVRASAQDSIQASVGESVWSSGWVNVHDSVRAYASVDRLAFCQFFAAYLAPNDVQALARFNELVSGYWPGQDLAVIVRRPKILSRDEQGRLHSATGKCVEYRDGWGFYAWHGVRVPEQVILDPDRLTRDDFLNAENAEVRRVIEERMGQRFVPELGGVVIDTSPRGMLYEVTLPDDPAHVARYVQVQDASTARQYFLRVPPTVQTADEAVAWSFQMAVEEYGPAQET